MMRRSHSLAMNDRAQSDHTDANASVGTEVVRRALKLLEPKRVAAIVGVQVRRVQKWVSGDAAVPEKYITPIVLEAKTYFLTDLNQLEDAIDRMLINQYGPNRDPGVF